MSSTQELSEVLAVFGNNLTNSKFSVRKSIFSSLNDVILKASSASDLPDAAIKIILKQLYYTLGRYNDHGSRRLVCSLVLNISSLQFNSFCKFFSSVFGSYASSQHKASFNCNSSEFSFALLSWTCVAIRTSMNKSSGDAVINTMIELQTLLLNGSLASMKPKIHKASRKRMDRIWREKPELLQFYISYLQKSEASVATLVMLCYVLRFLNAAGDSENSSIIKELALEQYLKTVISSRSKPEPHVLLQCSKYFLPCVSHTDLKSQLLPAINKSMLRNPELILKAVVDLIKNVVIDLSSHTDELIRNLSVQLISKDEQTSALAVEGCKNLASQITDCTSVHAAVSHIFKVLSGSEGKLTLTSQRMSVVSAAAAFSGSCVSWRTDSDQLFNIIELFITPLQQEVHESMLTHTFSALSLWCTKLSDQVPPKLTSLYKTILKKSTSPLVRNACIACMSRTYIGDCRESGLELVPLLLTSLERCLTNTNQPAVISESLSAALLLLTLYHLDGNAESNLNSLWQIVLDTDKQVFTNERFLAQATEESLNTLTMLFKTLISEHVDRLTDPVTDMYSKGLIFCMLNGSYSSRNSARKVASKLVSMLGGFTVARSLLNQFSSVLKSLKISNYSLKVTNGTADDSSLLGESQTSGSESVTPRALTEALVTMTTLAGAEPEQADEVAYTTLFMAHHPSIYGFNVNTWVDILRRLGVDVPAFIEKHADSIISMIAAEDHISSEAFNTLKTLVRVSGDSFLPKILPLITGPLTDASFFTVTCEEVSIMNHPEGKLFDQSVIQKSTSSENNNKNIKRESKLYSYKEQMADLELRKELERKKQAKLGKSAEPQLTKKQKEAVDAQLAKEKDIRDRLLIKDRSLDKSLQILDACIEGNSHAIKMFLPELVDHLLDYAASPLASPRVTKSFTKLGECVLGHVGNFLALVVSYATLRMIEPQCDLDSDWTHEAMSRQVTRAVSLLYRMVSPEPDALHSADVTPLSAPTFAFCFPLFKSVCRDFGSTLDDSDTLKEQALTLINIHAKLRSGEPYDSTDQQGPEFLPRANMMHLLIDFIATGSGKLVNLASEALQQVCMAASSLEGCATATTKEIKELLRGLQSSASGARESVLRGLSSMVYVLPKSLDDKDLSLEFMRRLWVSKHDPEPHVSELADNIWSEMSLELDPIICTSIVADVIHHEEVIRRSAADGLAAAVTQHPDCVTTALKTLLETYEKKLYLPPPVMDNLGRVISESPPDQFDARSGIAMAIGKLSSELTAENVDELFKFIVESGLGDRHADVRQQMLTASLNIINDHGKENINTLLPVFESFLSKAPDSSSFDAVRQSVVILMGSLAKHLDKDDPKVKPIVAKLIQTFSTPSQQVQEAIANCLPPLVPAIKSDVPEIIKQLLQLLLESDIYGDRRGAAYGIAGLVKGLGILALKQLDIMSTLETAILNKKNAQHREGALFAFELLCVMLGRLFEPYVVHILPHLLLCFGDANQYVREAANETAKAIMSKLSAHGVKLVLPSLLKALEEDSWRTKTGSVDLLGAMAFCAPKQLSACLPNIVPKLTEVLTDSHQKVQKSGAQALKQIGSVIQNPEIQAIVPNLLDALQEPTKKTNSCMATLLATQFIHFIDAPSLALIMPVVKRAFQDRSTETRKMAAQIIGNMYSLTDPKDLSPYLPTVIPGLKQSLLDPAPEVRTASSRALGAIVKGMGETGFEELVPWLMSTLTSEVSSVDRSGAAQGLAEVIGGLGVAKLHQLMPNIVQTAERTDIAPHVRDGYVMMYIYLPIVFTKDFVPYIGPSIPSILQALADESEFVRETAIRAGQKIVNMYADTAIELLLPELESGLFDENWRIRYASVQLLGDLLYKISGVSGKMSTQSAGEDDNFGTENSMKTILKILGAERRNRVLAGLYMGRSDTALLVRQSALHVWKVIVHHTPKMLREILSTLFSLLLGCLASTSYDKRQVAARTLGDVVRKLGEKVLPEIIPILESGLESDEQDKRQGVCIGLSEIMESTSKDHILVFSDSLIPAVSKALCDPLPDVRQAAAKTFDNLHYNIGSQALDRILPALLKKLDDNEQSEFALDALRQVMSVKSRVVLPYLVPQLTSEPVNTRALAFISSVAGDALSKHLPKILPAIIKALGESLKNNLETSQQLEYCSTVVLAVKDEPGQRVMIDEVIQMTRDDDAHIRWAAISTLHQYCESTKEDFSDYVPQFFRDIIKMFTDDNEDVLNASWDCLNSVTKKLETCEMHTYISDVRQAIRYAVADLDDQRSELPGFCLPKKGITPILPIFREGILSGAPEVKESSAAGLGELFRRTTAEALRPSIIGITGPLIRVLSDRFSFNVQVAILETLGLLLSKCGPMLKAFLPQLQTTFIKALNDPNRTVRLKTGFALSQLIMIHPRVDPVFTELFNGIKNSEEPSVRNTMLQALRGCLPAGPRMNDSLRHQLDSQLTSLLSSSDEITRTAAGGCLGSLLTAMKPDETSAALDQILSRGSDWTLQHGRSSALQVALKQSPELLLTSERQDQVLKAVLANTSSDRLPITCNGFRAIAYYLDHQLQAEQTPSSQLFAALTKGMRHDSNDVKQLCAHVTAFLACSRPLADAVRVVLVPAILGAMKEKNPAVRSSCEAALALLLQLKNSQDNLLKSTLSLIDSSLQESLSENAARISKKVAAQPHLYANVEELDNTILC